MRSVIESALKYQILADIDRVDIKNHKVAGISGTKKVNTRTSDGAVRNRKGSPVQITLLVSGLSETRSCDPCSVAFTMLTLENVHREGPAIPGHQFDHCGRVVLLRGIDSKTI